MAPKIYTSDLPDVPILNTSIFTRLFASREPGNVGSLPGSMKAFIDAASGTCITRAQTMHLSLSFAYGIRDHPTTRPFAKRGDTVLIYSPNSLAWPVVLYGCTYFSRCFEPTKITACLYRHRGGAPVYLREQCIYEPRTSVSISRQWREAVADR